MCSAAGCKAVCGGVPETISINLLRPGHVILFKIDHLITTAALLTYDGRALRAARPVLFLPSLKCVAICGV